METSGLICAKILQISFAPRLHRAFIRGAEDYSEG